TDVDSGAAGCQFRPAAQAGTKAVALGGGSAGEEAAVPGLRGTHAAHRPAIDARRANADVEAPVETRIVGEQRGVAGIGVGKHEAIMRRRPADDSPFSDTVFEARRGRA